ncbi:MAG: site-specific integrase, partial [Candidatus Margulisbacteria bacterium]|nr:site-specific integrase [Candidatus Margulisiibacteriota bacterium]
MEKEKVINSFKNKYKGLLSDNTLKQYVVMLGQLLDGEISITSKSKYLQYKTILAKLGEIGIDLDVNIPKWTKKGSGIKKNILDKYVGEDDLQDILECVPGTDKGRELARAIEISYYSGLRLAEVLGLKASDIVAEDYIRLEVTGKGDKYRTAYLPRYKRRLVRDFVGFSISDRYVKKNMERISEKTGLNFSFHSFRHSFASNFLKKGGNIA